MFESIATENPKIVAFRINGKVTKEDMVSIFDQLKHTIEKHGEAFIYEEIHRIGGVELGGVLEKIKYLFTSGLSGIKRCAIVTDKEWIATIVDLKDQIIKSVDMRCFPLEQKDEAMAFLESESA